jgi:predicted ArsR family transcriptional regulator
MAALRALIAKRDRMLGAEELADYLGSSTGGIARTLEDLAAHGVVTRDTRQYDADPLWCVSDWTVGRWRQLGFRTGQEDRGFGDEHF